MAKEVKKGKIITAIVGGTTLVGGATAGSIAATLETEEVENEEKKYNNIKGFKNISGKNNFIGSISSLTVDDKGVVWATTTTNGLYKLENGEQFTKINVSGIDERGNFYSLLSLNGTFYLEPV